MKILYITLVVALLALNGCVAQQKAGTPVYEGPKCFEDISLPGDTLWNEYEEWYDRTIK